MRTTKHLERLVIVLAAVLPGALAHQGCSSRKSSSRAAAAATTDGPAVQVERLGRPAIGEGLLIDNGFLLAFNSISPDQDLAVYTTNTAFRTQVQTVLGAVDDAVAPVDNVNTADIEQAFFPDVMRIDTTLQVPVGTAAYPFAAVAVGTTVRPIAGRKLEDDVIDITLSVVAGGALSDNVDYRDPVDPNDGNPGGSPNPDHDLLNGQTVTGGAATFPFLAAAN
jgi:hypothetical protein